MDPKVQSRDANLSGEVPHVAHKATSINNVDRTQNAVTRRKQFKRSITQFQNNLGSGAISHAGEPPTRS